MRSPWREIATDISFFTVIFLLLMAMEYVSERRGMLMHQQELFYSQIADLVIEKMGVRK